MAWTILGDAIPDPLSIDDNGGSITVDGAVQITDGTNAANTFAADTGYKGQVVGGGIKTTTWTYSGTGALAAIDLANYAWVSLQWTATSSTGTATFQVSNDNVVWSSAYVADPGTTASPILTKNSPTLGQTYWMPRYARYFRVSISGSPSGTNTITAIAFSTPAAGNMQGVAVLNTAAVSAAVSSNLANPIDAVSNSSITSYGLGAMVLKFNGATWDRERLPVITKTATATASGDTALWTPTSGKKFRLMRYQIQVTADAATSGGAAMDIVLRDATTAVGAGFSVYVPAAGGTAFGNATSGWIDLGHGVLSAAANNVLNINLSAALTAGRVRVVCAGTEE